MISNEETIYKKLCEVHPLFIKSITDLSYNDADKCQFIISNEIGFCFDGVLNSNATCAAKNEKSPDAVFYANKTLHFVELKSGAAKKHDIRLKIHEGLITLYHFVKNHISDLTRDDFLKLNIRYAVFIKHKIKGNPSPSILTALENSSMQFNLQNMEGLLITKTHVLSMPQSIVKYLNTVTEGKVTYIDVIEGATPTRYTV